MRRGRNNRIENVKKISLHKVFSIFPVAIVMTLLFVAAFFIFVRYLQLSARNVVFMDYWRFISNLIPKVFDQSLQISDFFAGVQKNPLMLFMVYLDIRFFNLNCLWETYAGLIVNFVLCALAYWVFLRKLKLSPLLFIPILLFSLNLNRWEIITTQFYFSFAIRILLYTITFYFLDVYVLCNTVGTLKKSIFIGILLVLEIVFVSQLYFPALVFSIVIALFLCFFLNEISTKRNYIKYCCVVIGGGYNRHFALFFRFRKWGWWKFERIFGYMFQWKNICWYFLYVTQHFFCSICFGIYVCYVNSCFRRYLIWDICLFSGNIL